MSDKLTPEEIAAFCDAVEWYAINHRDRALSANKFAAQCDLETRWDVVLRILPKIRAIAAPAAVPVSELQKLCNEWRNACDPEDFIHAGEDCDTCACREMLEGVIEGTYEFEELPPLPGAEGGAP